MVAEHDITTNTLPTTLGGPPLANMSARGTSVVLAMQRAIGAWGWLNYYLLSFAKL